jgi:predicted acyl esterase
MNRRVLVEIKTFNEVPKYDPQSGRWKIVKEILPNGKECEVIYRKGSGGMNKQQLDGLAAKGIMASPFAFCADLNQRVYDATPDIVCHQDVAIKLRDGVTIYADIYMPKKIAGPYPLIMSWSPFGKRPFDAHPGTDTRLPGVPPHAVSNMTKFESADPGYWCHYGYAVANIDPRGVGNSEGDACDFGNQDGPDGYDFIEWAAGQEWSSGKVTMFGNSGVCMPIWRIAAEQPPHLTCIGAWEGTGDMYRESLTLGGIDAPVFNNNMVSGMACKTWIEDNPNMLATHPFIDDYWQERIPKWKKISCPAYIAAGLCHMHLRGSLEAFRRISSPKKWLRMHRDMEWPDAYNPDNLYDLRRFYDRYMKDVRNGWEFTPKVRVDVLDAFDYDFREKRKEDDFPLKRTEYRKIYLDAATHSASYTPFTNHSEVTYDPKTDTTTFDIKFEEETEITGYISLRLFVECRGHYNMDLLPWIKKLGQKGEYIPVYCMGLPFRGAWAYARCTHRELDPEWSSDFQPVQAHHREERMEPGRIYPVDIEFYPHARIWHKGESLRLEIAGRFIVTEWSEDPHMVIQTDNGEGIHVIHTGGEYGSYLQIPFIPPKYTSGEYTYI